MLIIATFTQQIRPPNSHMTQIDFDARYSRQIKLPLIGQAGQEALDKARVLVVGMGGLGSPVALYLAAAGVGHLILADFDVVEESNLQRQIIHGQSDIGRLKSESAADSLKNINPDLTIDTLNFALDHDDLLVQAKSCDLIVDCTDNFPTRFELNRVSLTTKTPLVSGAAIRFEGQVTAFDPNQPDSPCYQCLYPNTDVEAASCAMEGVIAPLVGVIGTMQALEAINILVGNGQLHGNVWLFDAQYMEWQKMGLPKNPNCPACSS